ncbi:MAG: hypothetical protein Q7K57_52505 [Burkholderiaceae bacterium]|nr:hypothetical protein [Burkholderiaceae bacterium]
MTNFRFIPLAVALVAAGTLTACNTTPTMPMGSASASSMATPDNMARMDAQMKTMRDMHEKMMGAKTPQERSKLMAEHMKSMQDGMAMMNMMGGSGMGGMGGTQGGKPMPGDMNPRQQMMEKRMDMMQSMMQMMMDQMPAAPAK